jgi:hypothetical protein
MEIAGNGLSGSGLEIFNFGGGAGGGSFLNCRLSAGVECLTSSYKDIPKQWITHFRKAHHLV